MESKSCPNGLTGRKDFKMEYYAVTDVKNDDVYYCKADCAHEAIMKAQRFWNSGDPYCEFIHVRVEIVEKKEYDKYVNR